MKHFSLNRLRTALPAVLLLGALSLATAPSARAQITLVFAYDGTDTVATFTILSGATLGSGAAYEDAMPTSLLNASIGSDTLSFFDATTAIGADAHFETGTDSTPWSTTLKVADSRTGDAISFGVGPFLDPSIWYPSGYDIGSGPGLTGSATWLSTDIIGLGFASNTPASGTFNYSGVAVNWSTTVGAVPEPSTYAAIFGAIALVVTAYRRRRSVTSANA